MRIAILGDTHFGARNGSPLFARHQLRFFREVFWPAVNEHGIEAIVHVGDVFDVGWTLSMEGLAAFNEAFVNPCKMFGLPAWLLTGNHDLAVKKQQKPNMVREVLSSSTVGIRVVDAPTHIDNGHVLLMPWITPDIAEDAMMWLKTSTARYVIGHFEITGAKMGPSIVCEHGLSPKTFKRFRHVYSGHFHCRSTLGSNITYVSTPLDLNWGETGWHGFSILESTTGVLTDFETPWRIHNRITSNTLPPRLDDSLVRIEYTGKVPEKLVERARVAGAVDVRAIDVSPPPSDLVAGPSPSEPLPATRVLIREYVEALADDPRVPKARLADLMERLYDMALQQGESA